MLRLDIDLSIAEEEPGTDGTAFAATVTAAGREVVVTIDDASRLPRRGGRRVLRELAPLADGLARRGVAVRVEGSDGLIVAVGDVRANAVQRLVSGSQHVKVGGPVALSKIGRGTPLVGLAAPPPTLLPLVPTLARVIRRRRPTTTHAAPGAGRPRLVFAVGTGSWDDSVPYEYDLLPTRTRIGSGDDVDLRLPGLEPLHAEILHREADDEYVLHAYGPSGGGAASSDDGPPQPRVLRTGARIELGAWRLAYVREEFADHGRPYGGRQGGELAIQRRQPPRRSSQP